MLVLDPTGIAHDDVDADAPWSVDLRGKTLGVLWNGKPNADNMFRILSKRLQDTYGVADIMWINKSEVAEGPGRPATDEILDQLAAGTVAVLTGSGD